MTIYQKCMLLLVIVGGLNWGIYGIWGFNTVGWLVGGSLTWLARIIFVVVGIAALLCIPGLFAPGPREKAEPNAP
ncbi:MAG: DUF378 domain-containing protein [Gemmiger sp.]|nr:DUF378 domain-containing protein [Gemmiger sp.]